MILFGAIMCRVIDAFVDQLAMAEFGFGRADAAETGRPGYDPSDLPKLYLYGYLHTIRSSRKLEAECRRNVELMWLLGRLYLDHKSIAEFRRTHRDAVTAAGADLVRLARSCGLIRGESIAIDGTKFRAVASAKSVRRKQPFHSPNRCVSHRPPASVVPVAESLHSTTDASSDCRAHIPANEKPIAAGIPCPPHQRLPSNRSIRSAPLSIHAPSHSLVRSSSDRVLTFFAHLPKAWIFSKDFSSVCHRRSSGLSRQKDRVPVAKRRDCQLNHRNSVQPLFREVKRMKLAAIHVR
jgi:transposase